jgi:integrase
MPRPKKDGTAAAAPNRRKLSEVFLQRGAKPKAAPYCVWDVKQGGLAVLVQPTGHKAWKCVYHHHGKPRWVHLGDATAIGLSTARKLAAQVMAEAANGKDPLSERRAKQGRGTFDQLATRYLEEKAKKENKSWKQARALVERNLLPKWGNRPAQAITRANVKEIIGGIAAPITANQTLAAASAIFSWGVKEEVVPLNPCVGVDRNEASSRARVLSESEFSRFWAAFDSIDMARSLALKFLLLVGQRPGEVRHLRYEHIKDGWWELPGKPVEKILPDKSSEQIWPGTKNAQSHRVWIPTPAQKILAELADGEQPTTGFVFAGPRGGAVADLDGAMRDICADLKVEKLTPHDLRRSHGTMITRLKFGRDAMNRIQNHRQKQIADTYDQYTYEDENKQIMEAVAAKIMALIDGDGAGNVVELATARPR